MLLSKFALFCKVLLTYQLELFQKGFLQNSSWRLQSSLTSYYKQTSQALINLSINCCGNIIANPGPKECSQICHWDLNRIAAYNFTKVSFLQVLSTTYFIFLYEIFLNQISFTMIISIFKDIISFAQTILTIKREWVCILKNKSLL